MPWWIVVEELCPDASAASARAEMLLQLRLGIGIVGHQPVQIVDVLRSTNGIGEMGHWQRWVDCPSLLEYRAVIVQEALLFASRGFCYVFRRVNS